MAPSSKEAFLVQQPSFAEKIRRRRQFKRTIKGFFHYFIIICLSFGIIVLLLLMLHMKWNFSHRLEKLEKIMASDGDSIDEETANTSGRNRRHKDCKGDSCGVKHGAKSSAAQVASHGTEAAVMFLRDTCKAKKDGTISCWELENKTGNLIVSHDSIQVKIPGYYQIHVLVRSSLLKPVRSIPIPLFEAAIHVNNKPISEAAWPCNDTCSNSLSRLRYLNVDDKVTVVGFGNLQWFGIRKKPYGNFVTNVFSVHLIS